MKCQAEDQGGCGKGATHYVLDGSSRHFYCDVHSTDDAKHCIPITAWAKENM